MKCIRYPDKRVERVSDEAAAKAVREGKAVYCPKSEWRKARKVAS